MKDPRADASASQVVDRRVTIDRQDQSAHPIAGRAGVPRTSALPRAGRRIVLPVVAMLLLIGGWQLATAVGRVPDYVLPSPFAVAAAIAGNWSLLVSNAAVTLEETLIGFALALVVGIGLSVVMTLWLALQEALYPLVVLTQVIPKVAIAPLVVLYLGFGQQPKIFLAFLIAFFPVVINTTLGLNSVAPELLELMATLGASRWQIMTKVRLHRAVPYIVEGSKITMTLAVIGAIVAELDSGSSGLGYLIKYASSEIETALAFASLVVLVAIGVFLFEAVDLVGRLLMPKGARAVEIAGGSRWTS